MPLEVLRVGMSQVLVVDVVIVGSGFAGSLTAAILSHHGLRVALLDRARHPRFAIGESSTPTANFILRDLAQRHDLPELVPLCKFGPWRRAYPEVMCGLKRGFSYFQQVAGREFMPDVRHRNELLVAASADDDLADTQWLRADVDAFLFRVAQSKGAMTSEEVSVGQIERQSSGDWRIETSQGEFRCRFLIDATGHPDALKLAERFPRSIDERDSQRPSPPKLQSNSRSIFGHFAGLPRWEDLMQASSPTATLDHPFHADDAALHHVLDEGWMWWIRFANDVTSVGLVLDNHRFPGDESQTPEDEWRRVLGRYPALSPLLNAARLVEPQRQLIRTGRLQRCAAQCFGDGWAILPHTAGFIDPLHSTGIAYSLAGVDRLTQSLLSHRDFTKTELLPSLEQYERAIFSELELIDLFVSGAYIAIELSSFPKFVAFAITYFAAATTWEHQRIESPAGTTPPLFLADQVEFRQIVAELWQSLGTKSDGDFESLCAERLTPFNRVGLFSPPCHNMYGQTAAPELEPLTFEAGNGN